LVDVTLAIIFLIVVGISILITIIGFGDMLILIAVLSLFYDIKIAIAIATLNAIFLQVTRTTAFRKHIDFKILKWLAIGIVPGSLIGLLLFNFSASNIIKLIFGLFLVAFVVQKFIQPSFKFKVGKHMFIFISFIFAITTAWIGATGPLLVVFMLQMKLDKKAFTTMMGLAFLISNGLKLIGYSSMGFISMQFIWLIIVLAAGSIIGTLIGKKVIDKIPHKIIEKFILLLLFILGLKTIWGAI